MGHNRGDGSSQGSSNNGGSHNGGSMDTSTTSGEVVSTGSSHGRLIKGDHGSVGMSHQVGVQVQGTSIAIASSIARVGRSSNKRGGNGRASNSWASNHWASVAELGSKVVSPGSSNCRLIHRDHSAIGVSHQAKEARS